MASSICTGLMLRTVLRRSLDNVFCRRACIGVPFCRTLASDGGKRSTREELFKDVRPLHTNTSEAVKIKAGAVKVPGIDLNKVTTEFFKINMTDLKQAPLPAFWVGFAGLVPLMLPPLTSILIGFSPALTYLQLAYATALLSCVGGIKWGYVINASPDAHTWENYGASVLPCLLATTALCLPSVLSFAVVIIGYAGSFIIDLNSTRYPPWFLALRGVLTNVSIFFLTISMFQTLIH